MIHDSQIETLIARQALLELSSRYCCAVDRLDTSLMTSLWWPGATVDVGVFEGDALAYSEVITTPNESLRRSHHSVSNPVYRLAGDTASGQVYVNAASTAVVEGKVVENLVGGRYVDEYERRDGEWRFTFRAFVIDWALSFDSAQVWGGDLMSVFPHQGARAASDFSRHFLPW